MRDWQAREEWAEHLAEHGGLCISQCHEIMQLRIVSKIQSCASLYDNTAYPVHWYALDTQLEYLDDEGHVVKRVKECALCGHIHEETPIVAKVLKRGRDY
jgi:hypothetical protein